MEGTGMAVTQTQMAPVVQVQKVAMDQEVKVPEEEVPQDHLDHLDRRQLADFVVDITTNAPALIEVQTMR
jgi:hypothetical protein